MTRLCWTDLKLQFVHYMVTRIHMCMEDIIFLCIHIHSHRAELCCAAGELWLSYLQTWMCAKCFGKAAVSSHSPDCWWNSRALLQSFSSQQLCCCGNHLLRNELHIHTALSTMYLCQFRPLFATAFSGEIYGMILALFININAECKPFYVLFGADEAGINLRRSDGQEK